MSPLLVMLFAAFGPMLAVFDPFGEDTEDEVEDEEIPIGMPDMGTTTGAGMDDALTPDPAEPEADAPTDTPTTDDPAVENIDDTAQPPRMTHSRKPARRAMIHYKAPTGATSCLAGRAMTRFRAGSTPKTAATTGSRTS